MGMAGVLSTSHTRPDGAYALLVARAAVPAAPPRALLRVSNVSAIENVYGRQAARHMLRETAFRIASASNNSLIARVGLGSRILVEPAFPEIEDRVCASSDTCVPDEHFGAAGFADAIRAICRAVELTPFVTEAGVIHALIEAEVPAKADGLPMPTFGQASAVFDGSEGPGSEGDRYASVRSANASLYRSDMEKVTGAIAALSRDRDPTFGGARAAGVASIDEAASGSMASGSSVSDPRASKASSSRPRSAIAEGPATGEGSNDGPAFTGSPAPVAAEIIWQPIRDAACPAQILYSEASVGFWSYREPRVEPQAHPGALDRTGFSGMVSSLLAHRVIDRLERFANLSLGLCVPVPSDAEGLSWEDVLARLHSARGLARRLVVQIAETDANYRASHAASFLSSFREAGCQIAITDFGAGAGSVRQLIAIAPDIVKLHPAFVSHLCDSRAAGGLVEHLVGVAQSQAQHVIMPAIDTPSQSDLAHKAGMRWQQGRHWGAPSIGLWRGHKIAQAPQEADDVLTSAIGHPTATEESGGA